MARINGSGFKMKRTPVKGRLGDFFSSLGKEVFGKDARQKRVDKQLESKKGTKYEGMTSMEAARAEKKSRKPGESKFQADSRRMGEKKKADKKANKAAAASSIKGEDFGNKNREKRTTSIPTGDGVAINIKETPAKPKTKVTGAIGSKTRKKQYDAMGLKYDDTIKGYNRDGSKKTLKEHLDNVAANYTGSDKNELEAILDAAKKEYRKK